MIDKIIQFFFSLLFFVTPIFMSKDTSELFEFNKMLFIYVVTVLIAFFWLLKMVIHKKIILKKTFLDIPIIFFLLSQLISTIFSLDRHTSIFGYYGRFNGGLISILSYIILYYAFVSNQTNLEKTLKAILASSLLVILWAIPGKFGYDLTCFIFTGSLNNLCWDNSILAFRPELRAFSTLGQPNWLGAYLAVTFFIGIYFLLKNQKINLKSFLLFVYLILNFLMILFTDSRSSLIALIIGGVMFGFFYFHIKKPSFINKKLVIKLIFLFTILIFFISFLTFNQNKLNKVKSSLENKLSLFQGKNPGDYLLKERITDSFDIRAIVWGGALKLGLNYPLFGTGLETFAYSYYFVRPAVHNLTSEWDYVYNKAHNEYLNYLATTGFIGLGTYLCFIVMSMVLIFRKIKNALVISAKVGIQNKMKIFRFKILTMTLFCGWLTILITNFFGFSTTTIQLFFYLIPAFIIFEDYQQTETKKTKRINIYQWMIIFVLVASTIYLLFSIIIYYLADINYSYGQKYSKINDQQKAAEYFEKALKLKYEPVYEDKFSASLAYLSAIFALQNQKDLAKQIATMSDSYNRKTVKTYPKNIFYWKTRAKNMFYFYKLTGDDNELLQGVEALKTAKSLYSTDPRISYNLALYYSTLYDLSKNNQNKQNWLRLSISEVNKTIKLKSNYREAYLFKGQLLKKYGMISEAKQVFEYILKNFNATDEEVLKELKDL